MWVGELSFGCTLKTDKKQRVFGGEGGGAAAFDKDENEEQRQPASQPASRQRRYRAAGSTDRTKG